MLNPAFSFGLTNGSRICTSSKHENKRQTAGTRDKIRHKQPILAASQVAERQDSRGAKQPSKLSLQASSHLKSLISSNIGRSNRSRQHLKPIKQGIARHIVIRTLGIRSCLDVAAPRIRSRLVPRSSAGAGYGWDMGAVMCRGCCRSQLLTVREHQARSDSSLS